MAPMVADVRLRLRPRVRVVGRRGIFGEGGRGGCERWEGWGGGSCGGEAVRGVKDDERWLAEKKRVEASEVSMASLDVFYYFRLGMKL